MQESTKLICLLYDKLVNTDFKEIIKENLKKVMILKLEERERENIKMKIIKNV